MRTSNAIYVLIVIVIAVVTATLVSRGKETSKEIATIDSTHVAEEVSHPQRMKITDRYALEGYGYVYIVKVDSLEFVVTSKGGVARLTPLPGEKVERLTKWKVTSNGVEE